MFDVVFLQLDFAEGGVFVSDVEVFEDEGYVTELGLGFVSQAVAVVPRFVVVGVVVHAIF